MGWKREERGGGRGVGRVGSRGLQGPKTTSHGS